MSNPTGIGGLASRPADRYEPSWPEVVTTGAKGGRASGKVRSAKAKQRAVELIDAAIERGADRKACLAKLYDAANNQGYRKGWLQRKRGKTMPEVA